MHAAASSTSKGVYLARIVRNDPVCAEHWKFVFEIDDFPPAQPGQFLQILCRDPSSDPDGCGPFLRRPFSIGGLHRDGRRCQIDILHRAVGVGTRWLSRLKPGSPVSILGPLGKPFRLVPERPVAWLVGGGVGLPPLIWMAEFVRRALKEAVAFCGARSADLLPLTRKDDTVIQGAVPGLTFREFADHDIPVVTATDDGSLGAAGRIPDVFSRYVAAHENDCARAQVYTCGPEPMIRAVVDVCRRYAIPCQVCLERMMACGMGTCQSCVVRTHDENAPDRWRYRLCCTDGPVFDAEQVVWDS